MDYNAKFDGFDFSELIDAYELAVSDNDFSEGASALQSHLRALARCTLHEEQTDTAGNSVPAQVKMARRYVRELANGPYACMSVITPLWHGLYSVQDDFSFLQMFEPLVPYAWN